MSIWLLVTDYEPRPLFSLWRCCFMQWIRQSACRGKSLHWLMFPVQNTTLDDNFIERYITWSPQCCSNKKKTPIQLYSWSILNICYVYMDINNWGKKANQKKILQVSIGVNWKLPSTHLFWSDLSWLGVNLSLLHVCPMSTWCISAFTAGSCFLASSNHGGREAELVCSPPFIEYRSSYCSLTTVSSRNSPENTTCPFWNKTEKRKQINTNVTDAREDFFCVKYADM